MSKVEQKVDASRKIYTRAEAMEASMKYFNGDEMAATVWVNKYALKDSAGNLYEVSPEDMHKRIAREISRVESKYKNSAFTEEQLFDLLDKFKYIIPQGSPMAGIGNDMQYVSLSNCFVIGNNGPGDSYGSIMKTDQEQVQLMKRRGGVGHDLSKIRPAGSPVENSALTSTGVVPFMERYSNSTREVAQDGRRGALMLSISINHPDSEKFIDAKMDGTKVTGANVSVRMSDAFMKAVDNNESSYTQVYPVDSEASEAKYTSDVDPVKLWKKIIHNAWKSAEPGVLFWDTIINESMPDRYADLGYATESTNPCGEIPLCPDDSCRLIAINLYSYVREPFTVRASFDWDLFNLHAAIIMRMMDDIVDLELEKIDRIIDKIDNDPEDEYTKSVEKNLWLRIRKKCQEGRRTGIGITALGDCIAAMNLTYGTPEATEFAEKIQREYTLALYRESCKLAKERGPFAIWEQERELNAPMLLRIAEQDPDLYRDLMMYGRRNIAIGTIAPTGSVSVMTQTSSGIECVFAVSYRRRRKVNPNDKNVTITFVDEVGDSWEEYNVFHHKFVDWLVANNYDIDEVKLMADAELNKIIEKSPYYKALSNDVDWVEKVKMQGAMQKWIDHSISVTVNLPNEATEDLVNQVYLTAWKHGCKGCTIYRDGSRSGVLITNNDKEKKIEKFGDTHAPKRPHSLDCTVTFFNNKERWIGFIGLMEGRPYEIFTGQHEDFPVPTYVENGKIIREKGADGISKYNFSYVDKTGCEIKMPNLNYAFNRSYYDMAKTISAILRHGMPLPYVVDLIDTLNLDGDLINTWKSGVKRMMKKFIKDGTIVKSKCKDCGSESIEYREGCMTCVSCGGSKCG